MGSLNATKPKTRLSNSNLLFLIAAVIFVLMYGFAILSYPGSFLQFQTFFDLFSLNAPLIIMTLGLSIVMIGGGIDISVGAVTWPGNHVLCRVAGIGNGERWGCLTSCAGHRYRVWSLAGISHFLS